MPTERSRTSSKLGASRADGPGEGAGAQFTLAQLTARGAARWPEAPALVDGKRQLSFAALRDMTGTLARQLVTLGVQPHDRVAVIARKDIATVVALLAITEAGATYVPIDPQLPDARRELVLDDCAARLVLGDASLRKLAGERPFVALAHDPPRADLAVADVSLPEVAADDVAYLLYTSGSTGRPKGVLIEHGSVHAFFLAHNAFAGIAAGDRCMNTGPFHYDVSVMDALLPLYFGATVVLTPELPLPRLLLGILARERITHFYAVGSILALITGDGSALDGFDLSALRLLQTGAEVCNPKIVNQWLGRLPDLRFLNSYGPTELTVGCTCYAKPELGVLPEAEVPIGQLHAGSVAVLLDADGAVLGDDATEGELSVGGAQVMRGYFHRPEEEGKVFFEHAGVRFYRTGDRVRRDPDGQFFYLGRRDHEVKIDGVRVHLSETLRCLTQHPAVQSAVVGTVRTARGRLRVGAAVKLRDAATLDEARAVLAAATRDLPAAFAPAGLLACTSLPHTPSGKTDVAALMRELALRLAQPGSTVSFYDAEAARLERVEDYEQAAE